ncbi:hypothetical protein A9D14_13860 [Croceicoccus marinus]|uniref:Uncharacterized protein n=1 Tax=Croceicoccus marinus TaxID=450378 RepID=A0A1Z1FE77_9SPHN|nr:hypothetical protein A9D14_13860 [Croceicoccus marinus]
MKGKIEVSSPVETKRRGWRGLWLAVPVVAVPTLGWVAATRGPGLAEQAQAGTDFGARIACSCHFVEGRPIDQCRADFEPGMTMVRLSVEEETQAVTASVPMLASTRATYREGWGCLLEPWDG